MKNFSLLKLKKNLDFKKMKKKLPKGIKKDYSNKPFEEWWPAKLFSAIAKIGIGIIRISNPNLKLFAFTVTNPGLVGWICNVIFGFFLTGTIFYTVGAFFNEHYTVSFINWILFIVACYIYLSSLVVFIKFKKFGHLISWSSGILTVIGVILYW